jgi:hypothetical protein
MSDHEEFRRQLAARLRQVARDLLDRLAGADSREQKRQLVQRALAMVQNAEALQPFAVESERTSSQTIGETGAEDFHLRAKPPYDCGPSPATRQHGITAAW